MTVVVELWEEVTQAWAATIMAGSRAAQAERMAQESIILLVTAYGEASEPTQRVFALEGKLVAARQAQDATEEKILSLVANTVVVEWQQLATEEQCERLVHELTLLNLRGSELCMSITDISP
jgi:hypothetical protein